MEDNLNLNNNPELVKALEEFEIGEGKEKPGKPSPATPGPEISETRGMSKLIMKLSGGLIKEQKQAEYALLFIAVIFMLISLYFFLGSK